MNICEQIAYDFLAMSAGQGNAFLEIESVVQWAAVGGLVNGYEVQASLAMESNVSFPDVVSNTI